MKPTRLSTLAVIGVITGLLAFAAARVWDMFATPPGVPPTAPIMLLLIAAVMLATGLSLRTRFRAQREGRTDIKPVDPLVAARAVVFAKASSLVGALVAGAYGGYGVFLLGDWDVGPRRERVILCALCVLAALLLVAAALFVEWVCRVPPADGDQLSESQRPDMGPIRD